MTGTGTKNDPFIILTADDLYSMNELGGADICCRLEADIELNGTSYAEHFTPIPVNWSSLDGNGHKIRNIFISDPKNRVSAFDVMVDGTINISGLMLENTVMNGNVITLFSSGSGVTASIELYDCMLMLEISHNSSDSYTENISMLHGEGLTVSSDLCVISVSGTVKTGYAIFCGGNVKRTQVIVDLLTHDSSNYDSTECSLFRKVTASDSWITGTVKCDSSNSSNMFHVVDNRSSFSNCYQAISVSNISRVYFSSTFLSTCFYDKELMGNKTCYSTQGSSSYFHGLTTAQCKDPDYLTSIGFICGGTNSGL